MNTLAQLLSRAIVALLACLVFNTAARAQVAWQRFDANPLIPNFVSGGHALDPVVLYDASEHVYRMWLAAKEYGGPWSIYDPLSSDGTTWFLYAGNPVLRGGPADFESDGVAFAGVVRSGAQYVMLYEGIHAGYATAVGLATSPDGIEWTKSTTNQVLAAATTGWDSVLVGASEALRREGST